jgi:hypothetical protein
MSEEPKRLINFIPFKKASFVQKTILIFYFPPDKTLSSSPTDHFPEIFFVTFNFDQNSVLFWQKSEVDTSMKKQLKERICV